MKFFNIRKNMNTKYALSFIIAAIVIFLNIDAAYSQTRFGIKGGVDVIDHKISTDILDVKNRLGFQLGPTLEIMAPGSGIGAELSLLYGHKEYTTEDKVANTEISDYNYIYIPLTLKKRFGLISSLGIFISAGGFAEVKLDGGDVKIDRAIDDLKAKNFAAGLTAGAGVRLLNHFDLGMYYRAALTEKYSADKPEWSTLKDKKYQSWTVGLTYFF